MKQLIFVVETNKDTMSDNRYINKLIKERYDFSSNEIKLRFVHMEGKGKYNKSSVISQINKYKKECDGENIILYCFDTDKISTSLEDRSKFEEEKEYCIKNGYHLIWFNIDIEYVLLDKTVESNKKKQESIKFYKNDNIVIPENKLHSNNEELKGYSNMFRVLDDILPLKKNNKKEV